jgi:ribosomal protein L34E
MPRTCDYCQCVPEEGATKCADCGAPLAAGDPVDFRVCPFCRRRLLALGSPACNYCGRALPEEYVRAREATLRRIGEAKTDEDREALGNDSDDALKRALRSLFDLGDARRPE